MDVLKKIGNVFTILLAIVLSVILTVVLIVIPVVSAAASFTQGETLHKVMGEIDFSKVSENVVSAAQEQGINGDIVEDIMNTDAVGEVLDLYMDDAFAALEGNGQEASLTPEALQGIVGEHMDELVVIAQDFLGEDTGLTKEQVAEFVNQTIEENADDIIEMLPPAEEILPIEQDVIQEEVVQEDGVAVTFVAGSTGSISEILLSLRNGKSVMSITIAAAVLSLLILLCRIKRFQGLMWLGVVYLISAVITFLLTFLVGSAGMTELLGGAGAEAEAVITPVLTVIASEMKSSSLVIAICAVVFIIIFAVSRAVAKKESRKSIV